MSTPISTEKYGQRKHWRIKDGIMQPGTGAYSVFRKQRKPGREYGTSVYAESERRINVVSGS